LLIADPRHYTGSGGIGAADHFDVVKPRARRKKTLPVGCVSRDMATPLQPYPTLMKSFRSLVACVAVLSASSLVSAAEMATPVFTTIFNGKDLTGWKPNGDPSIWTVKNGILVGTNNAKREGSTISTEKSYKNFIIELDVKYMPPADSGITMRKPSLQMQIGTSHSLKTELTGSFYLGQLSYTDDSTAKDTWKHFKPGDWNTIRLQARGAIFTVWVNGQKVHTYADDKHPDEAPVNLQVHNNEQSTIEFRNIKIAELK
jgi:hypothetical protein